jgi:hypothetical protein
LKPLLRGHGDGRGCVRPADARRALRLGRPSWLGRWRTPPPVKESSHLFRPVVSDGTAWLARVSVPPEHLHKICSPISRVIRHLRRRFCDAGNRQTLCNHWRLRVLRNSPRGDFCGAIIRRKMGFVRGGAEPGVIQAINPSIPFNSSRRAFNRLCSARSGLLHVW